MDALSTCAQLYSRISVDHNDCCVVPVLSESPWKGVSIVIILCLSHQCLLYSGNHTQEASTTLKGHLGDKILNLEPKPWYYNWIRLRLRRLWRAWIYFDFRRRVNSLWPELGLLYSLDGTINYLTFFHGYGINVPSFESGQFLSNRLWWK